MGLHAVSAPLRLAGASLPSVLHEAGMCIVAQHQRCTIGLRTAARVPCCDSNAFHCVQVLAGLGNQTQQKLLNIPEAAAAVGVTNLQIPHTSVSKGGRLLKMSLKSRHPRALALCGTAVPPWLLAAVWPWQCLAEVHNKAYRRCQVLCLSAGSSCHALCRASLSLQC